MDDGWMDGYMDDGWTDGWMGRWDRWMWVGGQMDG